MITNVPTVDYILDCMASNNYRSHIPYLIFVIDNEYNILMDTERAGRQTAAFIFSESGQVTSLISHQAWRKEANRLVTDGVCT